MTSQELTNYFHYHNANMKLLRIGFEEIKLQIKSLYRKTNKLGQVIFLLADNDPKKMELQEKELALSRILSGIQVSWAEESIKRLLYESKIFTDVQRNFLINKKALDQKWYGCLLIVFSIAYDLILPGDELCQNVKVKNEKRNLGEELVEQYEEMRKVILDHLIPTFSIRNKVQHGEWKFAFEAPVSAVYSQDLTDGIAAENIVTTTARFHIVNAFYNMLLDMGRFKSNAFALDSIQTPFEYFYKSYIAKINAQVDVIQNPEIAQFRRKVAESAQRSGLYKK